MRIILVSLLAITLSACATRRQFAEPTFNEKQLQDLMKSQADGQNAEAARGLANADPAAASLWSRSAGNPYLVRNQKAQNIGDLLTIMIEESATATTKAKTDAKRDGSIDIGGILKMGQGSAEQLGDLSFTADHKNAFKGEGTTDRSGSLNATVQAVVENVLNNGTLYVRGRKVITINNEDQEVEVTGFVRPDDIRINNTVLSSKMADAKIRYVGDGVISDKQNEGWGTRFINAIWPF